MRSSRSARDPLFAPDKRRHPALTFTLLLLFVVFLLIFLLNHINNNRVKLIRQSVTVPQLPSAMENYRLLHISDLHGLFFGPHQERIAEAAANGDYQAVVITGDVTGPDGNADAFLALIDSFHQKVPLYFVAGDEDPAPIMARPHGNPSAKADYIVEAEKRGAIYLDAPVKLRTAGGQNLWLSPESVYSLDVDASQRAFEQRQKELMAEAPSPERDAALTAVLYQLDQLSRIRAARREIVEGDIHIAVTHHPLQLSALRNLQEWTATENESYVRTVSLVLAGHYVGGQWRLPLIGAVRAPLSAETGRGGWFPEDEKIVGLSSFLGIPQYINPGLGVSKAIGLPPVRLFNTPAITQLTLTTKLIH